MKDPIGVYNAYMSYEVGVRSPGHIRCPLKNKALDLERYRLGK